MRLFFSRETEEYLKKSQMGISYDNFRFISLIFSVIFSSLVTFLILIITMRNNLPIYLSGMAFVTSFIIFVKIISLIPFFSVKSKRTRLESDLLYSSRHLLLKLESGSSLINSLESVSKLKTNSAQYFREIVFDISMGVPIEDALAKAIEYSPSPGFTKIMEEIRNSLRTGVDINRTIKMTLKDLTKQHLLQIEEYGKKLNPISMFYMILGAMLPSIGTALLVVVSSLVPNFIIVDWRILGIILLLLAIVQIFFVLGFKSIKPSVID